MRKVFLTLLLLLVSVPCFAGNRYWVGGTASWNGTAGTKWALTSGGAGGQAEPTAADDVLFDANSGANTVTIDTTTAFCRSFNATGFTGALVVDARLKVGDGTVGNFTLGSGMTSPITTNVAETIQLVSTTGTNLVTTNGIQIGCRFQFIGSGGSWQLQDAFTQTAGTAFNLNDGTLDTNGKTVTAFTQFSNGFGTTLTLGSSSIICNGTTGTVFSFNAGSTVTANLATLTVTDTGADQKTLALGGFSFGTLNITGGGTGIILIQSSNTFSKFPQITGGTKNLRFTAGTTQTITDGTAGFGNGTNVITIDTQTAGSAATLTTPGGTVSCDYLSLKDSTAAGTVPFYAGANSTSVSGNTNWTFTAPPATYVAGQFFHVFD